MLDYLQNAWQLTVEMAPWLLLGFAVAGVCGHFLPEAWVQRHLARRSFSSLIKAVIVGIPLPLCSCGVIPVAAGLRSKGASKGAVAAFTAATPQTGVDSLVATYSLMGGIFTLARLLANLVSGVFAGVLINAFKETAPSSEDTPSVKKGACCCASKESAPSVSSCCDKLESVEIVEKSCCKEKKEEISEQGTAVDKETASSCCSSPSNPQAARVGALRQIYYDGFIKLPADLGKYLLLGIALGAALTTWVPADFMASNNASPWLAYVLVTLVSVPLYVCATGSIPLAFGLLHAGVSPGTALVFLIAGPATNTATILSLFPIIGKKETAVYLGVLIVFAWLSGFALDMMFPELGGTLSEMHEHDAGTSGFDHLWAVLFIAITAYAMGKNFIGAKDVAKH